MYSTARSPRFLPSPSSPTGRASRDRPEVAHSFAAPHSPVSPSLMSVATKSYVSSYGNNQHTDEMAERPPRSQTDNYMKSPQKPNTYVEGSLKRSSQEDDGQHRDKRQKLDVSHPDRMEVDTTTIPTNHDRQEEGGEESKSPLLNEHDQTAMDDSEEIFLLCKSSVSRSYPDPGQHLIATYGLLPLLKTVARNDPETGEKINKLRKSYEGQIKTFMLSGRNKPVKSDRDEEEAGPLRLLASVAEEEWNQGAGRSKIEVTSDFRAKLGKAMQLQPGTVRNNTVWEDLLGHEKAKPSAAPTPSQSHQAPRIPNGSMRPQQASSASDKRNTRGKKRSYGDDSFVGYGEGYSEGDDDGDDDDYARRKRKKDSFGPSSSYHNVR